jgi:membrane dipeptidase
MAGERTPLADDFLHRLREGGVRVELMTVGGDMPVSCDAVGRPEVRALELIDDVLSEVEACAALRVVRTAADLDGIGPDEVALVLHLEGLAPLQGRPELARAFHRLGVRSAQLTWNMRNAVADGVGERSPGGLSEQGRALVAELARLGWLLDVSHLAQPSFWELLDLVPGPLVASHANCAAVHAHPRNLADDQIRAIAARGGVVGVVFYPDFIAAEPSIAALLAHVEHLIGLVGLDHVAIGPDYAQFAAAAMDADMRFHAATSAVPYAGLPPMVPGLDRLETLPVFTAALLEHGLGEDEVATILGGNALRVLRSVLPAP